MMIHYGMSTYDGFELSKGDRIAGEYAPDRLDVAQWVSVARDAGMRYIVLTAKHVAGFALWPTRHSDYHVGNSGNTTDVIRMFVEECRKKDIVPCLYYCSWDNHHLFGSKTPSMVAPVDSYTTAAYQDFQMKQLEELLTEYGEIGELWYDIPGLIPRHARHEAYEQFAAWQPEMLVAMNHGLNDGTQFRVDYAWPTDLLVMEKSLPHSNYWHQRWRHIEGEDYYMPGEFVDTVGWHWFYLEKDRPRPDAELLGMVLTARSRQSNVMLNVGPDKHGLIPQPFVDSLLTLNRNLEKNGFEDIPLMDSPDFYPMPERATEGPIPLT